MKNNNIKNISGTLSRWTPESCGWYDRASEYTGYHKKLIEYIAPHLNRDMTCCELACGTGTLAMELAPYVSSFTANDTDTAALEFFKHKLSEKHISNISIVPGDWKNVLRGQKFDIVIFSFFSAVLNDWSILKAITGKKLIMVLPRSRQKSSGENSGRHRRRQENFFTVQEFLTEKNIKFTADEPDLEFGQPLYTAEEARDYVSYYYKLNGDDLESFIDMKLEKRDDCGLYFPKLKKIGIIAADM